MELGSLITVLVGFVTLGATLGGMILTTSRRSEGRLTHRIDILEHRVTSVGGRLDEVDARLSAQIREVDARLSAQIREVETKLTTQIQEVDVRLSAQIREVETKLTTQIEHVETKLTKRIDRVEIRFNARFDRVDDRLFALAAAPPGSADHPWQPDGPGPEHIGPESRSA